MQNIFGEENNEEPLENEVEESVDTPNEQDELESSRLEGLIYYCLAQVARNGRSDPYRLFVFWFGRHRSADGFAAVFDAGDLLR